MTVANSSMKSGIYKITNTVNGKIYIGQTKDFDARWSSHKKVAAGGKAKAPLYAAIRKYGVNAFEFAPIIICDSYELKNLYEVNAIQAFKSHADEHGYNISFGPAQPLAESTKEKLRQANLGKTIPPEVRAKISRPSPQSHREWLSKKMRGVPKTDEHRRKISEATKGRKVSEETVAKIVAKTRGQKLSEQARRNQSIGKTGRKATPEHSLNIAIGQARYLYRTTGRIDFEVSL